MLSLHGVRPPAVTREALPRKSPASSAFLRYQNEPQSPFLGANGRPLPAHIVLSANASIGKSTRNSYVKSTGIDSPSRRSPIPGYKASKINGTNSTRVVASTRDIHRSRPSSASGRILSYPTVYYHMEIGRTGRRVEASKSRLIKHADKINYSGDEWRYQCCDEEEERGAIFRTTRSLVQRVPSRAHRYSSKQSKSVVANTPDLQIRNEGISDNFDLRQPKNASKTDELSPYIPNPADIPEPLRTSDIDYSSLHELMKIQPILKGRITHHDYYRPATAPERRREDSPRFQT